MNSLSPQKPIIVLSDVGLFLIYPKHNLLHKTIILLLFMGRGGGGGEGAGMM